MIRILLIVGAIVVIALVASVVDCVLTSKRQVNILPKALWLLICVILPIVGPVLWFTIGRGKPQTSTTNSPDDDDEFLRDIDVDARIDDFERRMRDDERGNS